MARMAIFRPSRQIDALGISDDSLEWLLQLHHACFQREILNRIIPTLCSHLIHRRLHLFTQSHQAQVAPGEPGKAQAQLPAPTLAIKD